MLARNPRGPTTRLAMVAAALGLFMLGYYWGNHYKYADPTPPAIEGVLVHPPPQLPGFELRDALGQPFTRDSFTGHWTLLTFGELSLAPGHQAIRRMIEVYNRVAEDLDLQGMVQLVLVEEHQDQALAQDFRRLTGALKLLSGDSSELKRLRASLGASPGAGESPVFAASNQAPFYLIGPEGRLLALFPDAQPAASIASDLTKIAQHPHSLYPDYD